MNCQHCDQHPATTSHRCGNFFWDHICQWCKDRFKLKEWEEACQLTKAVVGAMRFEPRRSHTAR